MKFEVHSLRKEFSDRSVSLYEFMLFNDKLTIRSISLSQSEMRRSKAYKVEHSKGRSMYKDLKSEGYVKYIPERLEDYELEGIETLA